MLGRQHDFGAEAVRLAPDAGTLEAAIRIVARAVGDDDTLRARLERELDDGADDVGVRIRSVDRHPVPADVRLDDDHVAAADELLDAAHRIDCAADESLGGGGLVGLRFGDGELRVLTRRRLQPIITDLAAARSRRGTEATLIPD